MSYTVTLAGDAANGQNQRTYVIGGLLRSAQHTDEHIPLEINQGGGAVCFDEGDPVDCVSWGTFAAESSLPAPGAGTPHPGMLDSSGGALRRDVAAGCSSALEAADDTDDSAADFNPDVLYPGTPNDAPPPTQLCPQTTITDGPKKRTRNAVARFRFKSSVDGSSFECKLDARPFQPCDSPRIYTVKRGKHRLKVRATNPLGGIDASPASYRWRRIPR